MKLKAWNMSSGEVEIHAATCSDKPGKRAGRGGHWAQDQVEFGKTDWPTKFDFMYDYWNNGILEEHEAEYGVGSFDVAQGMDWKPCTASLPEGGPAAETAPAKISKREATQDLARRLAHAAMTVFDGADGSEAWAGALTMEEAQQKVADWLHHLPTGGVEAGGTGADRYWPEGFTRPSQRDWQK